MASPSTINRSFVRSNLYFTPAILPTQPVLNLAPPLTLPPTWIASEDGEGVYVRLICNSETREWHRHIRNTLNDMSALLDARNTLTDPGKTIFIGQSRPTDLLEQPAASTLRKLAAMSPSILAT